MDWNNKTEVKEKIESFLNSKAESLDNESKYN